jgi:hypothetical protein
MQSSALVLAARLHVRQHRKALSQGLISISLCQAAGSWGLFFDESDALGMDPVAGNVLAGPGFGAG